MVRACDEEIWRTHTEESVEGAYTREKEERTTENQMERSVATRFEKYWTESGRGDGQGDVEKKYHQLYRRPYIMGKARGKEEEVVGQTTASPGLVIMASPRLLSFPDWISGDIDVRLYDVSHNPMLKVPT